MLRDLEGKTLASGELLQVMHGHTLTSRMVFHFRDGSIDEQTTTFSQDSQFHLLMDHHVQKGPSFPHPTDVTIDTKAGTVTCKTGEKQSIKTETTHVTFPSGLANGLILDLVKNLPSGTTGVSLPYVAADAKPRFIKLVVTPDAEDIYYVAGRKRKAKRYRIKFEIGGVAGVVAPVLGKAPKDGFIWMAEGEPPTMLRAESQFFMNGPVWRVELASPTWPATD